MKPPILSCAIILTLTLAALDAVYANSATWSTNPTSGDWKTAANWMPPTVPNGPSDTATFASSGVTNVSISGLLQLDGIVFDAGADAFTITNRPSRGLTISGAGITNNSGVLQNYVNEESSRGSGQLYFSNGATAGDSVIYTNQTVDHSGTTIPPLIQFEDSSTAGSAQFINMAGGGLARAGVIEFQGNSTAGNGTFQNTGVSGQNSPEMNFRDQASAGEAIITNEKSTSSFVTFYDNSTADHATITNEAHFGGGAVLFYNNATAGSATIINEGGDTFWSGTTDFYDTSTAGEGLFIVDGSLTTSFGWGILTLRSNSKAGNATFIANGGQVAGAGGGQINLQDDSNAENGTFIADGATVDGAFGGRVVFTFSEPTAAAATVIATGGVGTAEGAGGGIVFEGGSTGGEPRVEVFGNGFLDIHTSELTIGSLEGDGLVFLGVAVLSVGGNNLSTSFSGLIEDGSVAGGSLTKIGTGTLTLSGPNTYSGGTTIGAGTLLVQTKNASGTGTGPVQVSGGTLGGRGKMSGAVTIGNGTGTEAFLAPGVNGAAGLTTQGSLTFNTDGTYSCEVDTSRVKADKITASGVTINNGAVFSFVALNNQTLAQGTVFNVINNRSLNPITGKFSNLPDGSTFTAGSNTFQASYEGGDGNDLTLTVVP
jgi:autotransporter-associated beta strand protein